MTDRYNTPDQGTSDWHVPLNENFQDISTDINNILDTLNTLGSDVDTLETDVSNKADDTHDHTGDTIQPNAIDGSLAAEYDGTVTHLLNGVVSDVPPEESEFSPDAGFVYIYTGDE